MTNKLPVVGKRYRELHNFNEWECSDLIIENEQSETGFAIMTALHNKTKRKVFNLNNYFFRFFEELPEDEAETKPTIKENLQVELSPEVKKAMGELKKADNWFRNNASITLPEHCFKLSNTAFCLLNALDKQFTDKEKLLTDREVLSEKPVNNDKILPSGKKKCQAEPKRIGCNYCGDEIVGDIMTQNGCCSVKCSIGLENKVQEQWDNMPIDENKKKNYWEEDNDFCPFDEALKEIKGKEKFILDSIYYDKQGLPVSIYKKEEEIDRIKMEKLREYFKEKYKSYETQPDENGSFKHIDGIEEETQDLMKESMKPNKETLKSFSDYEKGVGLTKYDSVEELFDDLEGKNS